MRRQRGSALVETALVMPLLLLLLMGALVLGRVGNVWETLNDAAREGARYSATPAEGSTSLPSIAAVQQRVQQVAAVSDVTLSDSDIAVDPAVTVDEGGLATQFSQVSVNYTYTFVTPLLAALVPSITLRAQAIMRNETD